MPVINKARSISDAEIQFVSLVDKAANQKSFLIAKAEDGQASFSAYGKIVKTDADSHYVTGIVYEPMVEDSQGDFMTEDEIRKAAHWFAKNGSGIDIQHNFEKFEKAEVVESWIAKADFSIGKEKIKKGTWLMTVEITDPDVWSSVEKGKITGFSMGGKGIYGEDNVELDNLSKSEGKSFFKKLAKMFGFEVVEKGAFADKYSESKKESDFYNAFYDLQNILYGYDSTIGKYRYEIEPEKIKECLKEFSKTIEQVLASDTVPVMKAGKTLSSENIEKLKTTYESIGSLLSDAGETEVTMSESEVMDFIKNEIRKAEEGNNNSNSKLDDEIKQYIRDTVKEFMEQEKDKSDNKPVTKEDVAEMMKKALEPVYKARGIATNLNDEPEPVKKESDVFAGLFM